MLLRHAIGHSLRSVRVRQGRTLREVADDAGVSLAHLSAIERGLSEASSEFLDAICGALGMDLHELLDHVHRLLTRASRGVVRARSTYELIA